jgi:hypothetical protein
LVLGGGGGAGTTNDGSGSFGAGFNSSGGSGGGMVFLRVGAVSGTGTINADGASGLSVENDGGGAGGAGGSVYFFSNNTAGLTNITINARGGAGGNAWQSIADNGTPNDGNPEHGPGGGGGGGVIYTNGTINASSSVAGGNPGVTTTSNLPYGAEVGAVGIRLTSATDAMIGVVKVFCDIDDDDDGITDATENSIGGADAFIDSDNDGIPNVYDPAPGDIVTPWVDANADGINDNFDTDRDGKIDQLDIDSDNDGITDNIEAQSTNGYITPSIVDTDNDGLNDLYELPGQIGLPTGNGLTPYDHDSDGIPDYRDTNSDGDALFDRNEGHDRNQPTFAGLTQATIDASGDTDGDGLMDIFDIFDITTTTAANLFRNVSMGNMGTGGNFDGPTPSGSNIGLVKSNPAAADRDWRNSGYAILPLNIVALTVNHEAPFAAIQWKVENEWQTNYYDVEFSLDGNDFTKVGTVFAQNTSSVTYNFNHDISKFNKTIYYYRIKQVDKNGRVYYTQVVTLKIINKNAIAVNTNPFNDFIGLTVQATQKEKIQIALFTSEGKVIIQQSNEVFIGSNSIRIQNLGFLNKGIYILRIQNLNNETQSFKLIKY